jgi:hypothetical protein
MWPLMSLTDAARRSLTEPRTTPMWSQPRAELACERSPRLDESTIRRSVIQIRVRPAGIALLLPRTRAVGLPLRRVAAFGMSSSSVQADHTHVAVASVG